MNGRKHFTSKIKLQLTLSCSSLQKPASINLPTYVIPGDFAWHFYAFALYSILQRLTGVFFQRSLFIDTFQLMTFSKVHIYCNSTGDVCHLSACKVWQVL